eukprot:3981201-Amphidinium_carterae.1
MHYPPQGRYQPSKPVQNSCDSGQIDSIQQSSLGPLIGRDTLVRCTTCDVRGTGTLERAVALILCSQG